VAVNARISGKFSNKKNSLIFVVRPETSLSAEFAIFFYGKFGKTFPAKLAELRPKVTPATVTTMTARSQWSQSCGRTFSPQ
jgi:hypothetical protein